MSITTISLSIKDIALFIAYGYNQKRNEGTLAAPLDLFKDVKAADLLSISEEGSLLWSFSPLDAWDVTLEPFSKGIHRALVEDGMHLLFLHCCVIHLSFFSIESGKYHILSQLDIVKSLYESGQYNEVFDKPLSTLQEMFRYQPKLVSITDDTPAIEVCGGCNVELWMCY
jgi:hypothetical protein